MIRQHLPQICEFYSNFRFDNLNQLPAIYVEDCVFRDPVHEVKGIYRLTQYFQKLTASIYSCKFEFHARMESDESAFLSWTMHYSHPRLNRGAHLMLDGVSELRFRDGKICYHRDYYDMGEMIYERLPVLAGLIRKIKRRLA